MFFFLHKETWILYRGNKRGVSKVVREAYMSYGDMEFGQKNRAIYEENGEKMFGIHRDDVNRHIKLISIAKKKVDILFSLPQKVIFVNFYTDL